MPLTIKDTDGGLGNLIEGIGYISGTEYLALMREHLSQDAASFSRYRYSLSDFSEVSEIQISNVEIEEVAMLCQESAKVNPNPLVAIVAKSDVLFGLSRMYEALLSATDWEIMVFRTIPEARTWIHLRAEEKFSLDALTFE